MSPMAHIKQRQFTIKLVLILILAYIGFQTAYDVFKSRQKRK